jgi:hypothetical protein
LAEIYQCRGTTKVENQTIGGAPKPREFGSCRFYKQLQSEIDDILEKEDIKWK